MSAASFDVPDVSGAHRTGGPSAYRDEDFPGCESFHLPAGELEHYEYRLEFWDGATETAWKVCEPTSIEHEGPSRRLVQMATRFEMLRGSRIACFGSADLVRVDAAGRKRWLMQADEVLYLHPDRVRLRGPAIDVDADPLPDVVLEVDHTTDVRRRKLGIYKEGGFAEVWVLVPWDSSRRAPGLAIHVRRGDGYREERSSRAFPGWRSEEIHRALTEAPMSEVAWRALERVALSMGAREGTKPEDDPLMRSHSAQVRTKAHAQGHREGHAQGHRKGHAQGHQEGHAQGHQEGHAQGHQEGHAQGHQEGHAQGHQEGHAQGHQEGHAQGHGKGLAQGYMNAVVRILEVRGIAVALDAAEDRELLGGLSEDALMAAALACTDAADFRRRVLAQRGRYGPGTAHGGDGP